MDTPFRIGTLVYVIAEDRYGVISKTRRLEGVLEYYVASPKSGSPVVWYRRNQLKKPDFFHDAIWLDEFREMTDDDWSDLIQRVQTNRIKGAAKSVKVNEIVRRSRFKMNRLKSRFNAVYVKLDEMWEMLQEKSHQQGSIPSEATIRLILDFETVVNEAAKALKMEDADDENQTPS